MAMVSIITVVCNDVKNIAKTIQSVINQDFHEIEYVIIDGGSTDGTLEVLNRYKEYIDVLVSEPDNGIYDAMNKGIKLAKGKYIGLLNSGDTYEPEVLNKIFTKIEEGVKTEVIIGNFYLVNKYFERKILRNKPNPDKLKQGVSLCHQAVFISSEMHEIYGLYDLKYKLAADFDFMLKLYLYSVCFQVVNLEICNYFVGGRSSYSFQTFVEKVKILYKNNLKFSSVQFFFTEFITLLIQKTSMIILGNQKYMQFKSKYLR